MPAVAEVMPTVRPTPTHAAVICRPALFAPIPWWRPKASAFLSENVISYLWTCDTCGYGFVTKHTVRRFACN